MKTELLELICCPSCHQTLTVESYQIQKSEIWEGLLTCSHCHRQYPIHKGMPYLYVDNVDWQPKAKEAEGWVLIHKNEGNYEPGEDAVDLKIPYFPHPPWLTVARSFDIALMQLNLTGNEVVLDLGAGRGWAAKHFALQKCRAVALDVRTDENVGLGRAKALMEDAGVYFDRIIGDGENLPFFNESFDIVFCAAALHHATNLPLFIKNISKVLKPGGRLCAINEPCLNVISNAEKLLARNAVRELSVGINETRPNLIDYKAALHGADLQIVSAFPPTSYNMDDGRLRRWATQIGAIRPSVRVQLNRQYVLSWASYLARRLQGAAKGSLSKVNAYTADTERQQIEASVLLWVGGEIILLAHKPH
ncbi:MAG: methyltransferase domain-containing protein [Candidatus Promineifilaceae bacterium]